ncbi:MAG: chorismate synthase [Bdellovibrionaceae bacterium]|nr:chorismate synthase [Pseudobdellovibrionaceae bacterium]
MSANLFGTRFCVMTFGESHGSALGAVVDGCPAGVRFDEELLRTNLRRRRPGQALTSPRQEADEVEVLSGVFEGRTLGTPVAMLVRNHDARSQDYDVLRMEPRAGHADRIWKDKFGVHDHRGGGRSSGRETVARVMAGSLAQMFVQQEVPGVTVKAYVLQMGPLRLTEEERKRAPSADIESFVARFPSADRSEQVRKLLSEAQECGESWGGFAELRLTGVPPGLGQPVFHKLKADLAAALLSVGATCGVEIGSDFEPAQAGTSFHSSRQVYGGIQGGISTGEEILARVAFKPTSSILDVAKRGRHDPCIIPRAIPVLESMVWLVLADQLLWQRGDKTSNAL